jgi:histidinol phosphatase-like enzyme
VCWCRKPLPGLGIELILNHKLDAARSLFVGRSRLDQTFAQRVGFAYRERLD